ncbi:hypothetical protein [Teredinibacter purpureus]|uniref:hypothetical protein n=1 Tax=Teredinibacter purpureus TaxID=2731756 RepID=UPI0005F78D2E|nr:hypothetical protein [Teredinibacter purpureus]
MYKIIACFLLLIILPACDPQSGFGCIAQESHPDVERARQLTQEELEKIYYEVHKLAEQIPEDSYGKEIYRSDIPDNLEFMGAEHIRINPDRDPYIILANCYDERIELTLSKIATGTAKITLHWAKPTVDAPYATGSQVLWEKSLDK